MVSKNKRISSSITVLVIIIIITGFFMIISKLAISQKEANEFGFMKWYDEVFVPSEYCGILKFIDIDEERGSILTIYTNDSERISYNLCNYNFEMMDFISENDSICKNGGSEFVSFYKIYDDHKRFKLDFRCDYSKQ